MKNIYIKLVIAGRNIATVPARDIVGVAAGVIIKGAEDGEEYITIGRGRLRRKRRSGRVRKGWRV